MIAQTPALPLPPPPAPEPERPLPVWWADILRGTVRCVFPVASLLVLALLVYSAQGRDVLRALVGVTTAADYGYGVSGLVFLWVASAVLSLSVWYAMRWLLSAQMAALPLPATGWGQTWLPRLAGAAAPLAVAAGMAGLRWGALPLKGDEAKAATLWALGFAALALALLLFYRWRGDLIVKLKGRGWIEQVQGRSGADPTGATPQGLRPSQIGLREPLPSLTLLIVVWSIVLSMILGLLFWLFPITLPRVVGAAAVAALALASINLFGSFVLTYAPLRHGLPPLVVWLVLVAGAGFGFVNDNHVVAPAAGAPATAAPRLAASAAELAARWMARVPKDAGGRTPLLVVASEGGGIRAAYWTAAVMDALVQAQPQLKPQLFALSGVSGGSVGLAAWLASHRGDWCAAPATSVSLGVSLRDSGAPRLPPAQALGMDFVAPAVAGMFYGDLLQRFLFWPVPSLSRALAIEASWQRALVHLPGQPLEHTLDDLYAACPDLPELMLNATRVESGQRVVLTRLPTGVSGQPFINTFDAMQAGSVAPLQSLAGLAHHSARFPLVSPAGTVPIAAPVKGSPPAFRLVDGGYFDNSGIQSALELMQWLQQAQPCLRPLLLVVRNEGTPLGQQAAQGAAPLGIFPEAGSIGLALLNVRGSHAVTAQGNALAWLGDDVIDLAVSPQTEAPLGWALSGPARDALDKEATRVGRLRAAEIQQRLAAVKPVAGCS